MSLNNSIIINKKTFEVYYQSCVDNDLKDKIAKGKNLEDAINKAEKWLEDNNFYLEYGYNFTG